MELWSTPGSLVLQAPAGCWLVCWLVYAHQASSGPPSWLFIVLGCPLQLIAFWIFACCDPHDDDLILAASKISHSESDAQSADDMNAALRQWRYCKYWMIATVAFCVAVFVFVCVPSFMKRPGSLYSDLHPVESTASLLGVDYVGIALIAMLRHFHYRSFGLLICYLAGLVLTTFHADYYSPLHTPLVCFLSLAVFLLCALYLCVRPDTAYSQHHDSVDEDALDRQLQIILSTI